MSREQTVNLNEFHLWAYSSLQKAASTFSGRTLNGFRCRVVKVLKLLYFKTISTFVWFIRLS